VDRDKVATLDADSTVHEIRVNSGNNRGRSCLVPVEQVD
jgi:hypothetical protein